MKAVIGGGHDVNASPGVVTKFASCNEEAVRLVGTSPHPATKLVKLSKAEAFGGLDDHDGSVGDIDTDLNDGSGQEDVGGAGDEFSHDGVLVVGLHLTVEHEDAVMGK